MSGWRCSLFGKLVYSDLEYGAYDGKGLSIHDSIQAPRCWSVMSPTDGVGALLLTFWSASASSKTSLSDKSSCEPRRYHQRSDIPSSNSLPWKMPMIAHVYSNFRVNYEHQRGQILRPQVPTQPHPQEPQGLRQQWPWLLRLQFRTPDFPQPWESPGTFHSHGLMQELRFWGPWGPGHWSSQCHTPGGSK